jgi:hypothetical protein
MGARDRCAECSYTGSVRRLLTFALLLVFSLPLIAPFFVADAAEATLPACCRRNGKHHCMMMMQFSQQSAALKFTTVTEKCPYGPLAPVNFVLPLLTPPADAAVFAGLIGHPAIFTQTQAAYRFSCIRTRQKRGPPANNLL